MEHRKATGSFVLFRSEGIHLSLEPNLGIWLFTCWHQKSPDFSEHKMPLISVHIFL